MLSEGGSIVVKAFPSPDVEEVIAKYKSSFKTWKRIVLQSSRKSSNEFYVLGKGFSQ